VGEGVWDFYEVKAQDGRVEGCGLTVRRVMPRVSGQVGNFLTMLGGEVPEVSIGTHYRCAFYDSCHANFQTPSVTRLPRLYAEVLGTSFVTDIGPSAISLLTTRISY
jgi:hypothetical protein